MFYIITKFVQIVTLKYNEISFKSGDNMTQIIRKGISFDKNELKEFDKLIKTQGYSNRSQAIRNLIRKELIENKNKKPERETVATLTMKYNHHEHHVQHELTHKQHTFQAQTR